jgi:hypothetical protein
MKFLGELLGFLAKLALFFLVVGLIIGFVMGLHAHAAEPIALRSLLESAMIKEHCQ